MGHPIFLTGGKKNGLCRGLPEGDGCAGGVGEDGHPAVAGDFEGPLKTVAPRDLALSVAALMSSTPT